MNSHIFYFSTPKIESSVHSGFAISLQMSLSGLILILSILYVYIQGEK